MKLINVVREKNNGITQPSGAATPRNSDAHERVAVPQALCALREHTRPRPKSGKAVLTPGHAWFLNRAKRSDGSDTTPARNAPVSPCEPLCAILLAKASVYPLSPVKTNVSRLCECDLKPLRRGLSHAVWDVTSADWAVIGGKQGSRRSPAKRVRWEEETQRNERDLPEGRDKRYGACADAGLLTRGKHPRKER